MTSQNQAVVICGVPDGVNRDVIRTYFEKKKHGGGKTDAVIHPFTGDKTQAMVIFSDPICTVTVLEREHKIGDTDVVLQVRPLPRQVFSTIIAEISPEVLSQFDKKGIFEEFWSKLQVESGASNIVQSNDGKITIFGNWYQIQNAQHVLQQFSDKQLPDVNISKNKLQDNISSRLNTLAEPEIISDTDIYDKILPDSNKQSKTIYVGQNGAKNEVKHPIAAPRRHAGEQEIKHVNQQKDSSHTNEDNEFTNQRGPRIGQQAEREFKGISYGNGNDESRTTHKFNTSELSGDTDDLHSAARTKRRSRQKEGGVLNHDYLETVISDHHYHTGTKTETRQYDSVIKDGELTTHDRNKCLDKLTNKKDKARTVSKEMPSVNIATENSKESIYGNRDIDAFKHHETSPFGYVDRTVAEGNLNETINQENSKSSIIKNETEQELLDNTQHLEKNSSIPKVIKRPFNYDLLRFLNQVCVEEFTQISQECAISFSILEEHSGILVITPISATSNPRSALDKIRDLQKKLQNEVNTCIVTISNSSINVANKLVQSAKEKYVDVYIRLCDTGIIHITGFNNRAEHVKERLQKALKRQEAANKATEEKRARSNAYHRHEESKRDINWSRDENSDGKRLCDDIDHKKEKHPYSSRSKMIVKSFSDTNLSQIKASKVHVKMQMNLNMFRYLFYIKQQELKDALGEFTTIENLEEKRELVHFVLKSSETMEKVQEIKGKMEKLQTKLENRLETFSIPLKQNKNESFQKFVDQTAKEYQTKSGDQVLVKSTYPKEVRVTGDKAKAQQIKEKVEKVIEDFCEKGEYFQSPQLPMIDSSAPPRRKATTMPLRGNPEDRDFINTLILPESSSNYASFATGAHFTSRSLRRSLSSQNVHCPFDSSESDSNIIDSGATVSPRSLHHEKIRRRNSLSLPLPNRSTGQSDVVTFKDISATQNNNGGEEVKAVTSVERWATKKKQHSKSDLDERALRAVSNVTRGFQVSPERRRTSDGIEDIVTDYSPVINTTSSLPKRSTLLASNGAHATFDQDSFACIQKLYSAELKSILGKCQMFTTDISQSETKVTLRPPDSSVSVDEVMSHLQEMYANKAISLKKVEIDYKQLSVNEENMQQLVFEKDYDKAFLHIKPDGLLVITGKEKDVNATKLAIEADLHNLKSKMISETRGDYRDDIIEGDASRFSEAPDENTPSVLDAKSRINDTSNSGDAASIVYNKDIFAYVQKLHESGLKSVSKRSTIFTSEINEKEVKITVKSNENLYSATEIIKLVKDFTDCIAATIKTTEIKCHDWLVPGEDIQQLVFGKDYRKVFMRLKENGNLLIFGTEYNVKFTEDRIKSDLELFRLNAQKRENVTREHAVSAEVMRNQFEIPTGMSLSNLNTLGNPIETTVQETRRYGLSGADDENESVVYQQTDSNVHHDVQHASSIEATVSQRETVASLLEHSVPNLQDTGRVNQTALIQQSMVPSYDGHSTDARTSIQMERQSSNRSSIEHTDSVYEPYSITTQTGIKVYIYKKDITRVKVDALVNAANEHLLHGAGVAGAISHASGELFDTLCQSYIQEYGPIKVGGVATVDATGRLTRYCTYVINAVGPEWYNYLDKKKCGLDLLKTFSNILHEANDILKVTSVAIPLISSGVFAVPVEICIKILYKAIINFSNSYGTISKLRDIHLVNMNEAITENIKEIFILQGGSSSDETSEPVSESESGSDHQEALDRDDQGSGQQTRFNPVQNDEQLGQTLGDLHIHNESYLRRNLEPGGQFINAGSSVGDVKDYRIHRLNQMPDLNVSSLSSQRYGGDDFSSRYSKTLFDSQVSRNPTTDVEMTLDERAHEGSNLGRNSRDITTMEYEDAATSHHGARPKTKEYYYGCTELESRNEIKHRNITETEAKYKQAGPTLFGLHNGNQHRGRYMTKSRVESIPHSKSNSASTEPDKCAICFENVTHKTKLEKCGHEFCKQCIAHWFRSKPVCPTCGAIYGTLTGTQPSNGKMVVSVDNFTQLPGHEGYGAIIISYYFPDGIQGPEHPHHGRRYNGTSRTAYLPNSREGQELCKLLKRAFDARLIFTVGRSTTTGMENVTTWNDIHHKTSPHGGATGFGYPDPGYLNRLREELATKGIK